MNLIRKLFLVKEIVSKEGEVHFRRYRLLSTPWFSIFIHNIRRSDEDAHMHDHPWHFISFIIKGIYEEAFRTFPHFEKVRYVVHFAGSLIRHDARDVHKITLWTSEVWTLVFTSGREREWGYYTSQGWIDFKPTAISNELVNYQNKEKSNVGNSSCHH